MNAGEDLEKKEHSCTVGGRINCTTTMENSMEFPQKIKIELPYDPEILLLGIYPEKTIIQKDTCTPIFIAALFTIARTWKQTKCPLTDEWIKKMQYIYTITLLNYKKE